MFEHLLDLAQSHVLVALKSQDREPPKETWVLGANNGRIPVALMDGDFHPVKLLS